MSDPIDIQLAQLQQTCKDGFENLSGRLEDIKKDMGDHESDDKINFQIMGERMGKQSERIADIDKKVVYATGLIIGGGLVLKLLIH